MAGKGVNWGEIFDKTENQAALIKSGAGLIGGMIGGNAAQQKADEDRQYSAKDAARNAQQGVLSGMRGQENADFTGQQAQLDNAQTGTLGAMGNSPMQFQRERMKNEAIANAIQEGGPGNLTAHLAPWARGMDMSKFRSTAASEQPYWDAVAQASKGQFQGGGMADVYGGAAGQLADERSAGIAKNSGQAWNQGWDTHRATNQANFEKSMGMANSDYDAAVKAQQEASKGGGFWGGLGGLLQKVAPLAAFIPGVGLPLAMGLGAVGNLAGSKMQGNSWGESFGDAAKGAAGAALGEAVDKFAPKIFGAGKGAPTLDTNAFLETLTPRRPTGIMSMPGISDATLNPNPNPTYSNTGRFSLGPYG